MSVMAGGEYYVLKATQAKATLAEYVGEEQCF